MKARKIRKARKKLGKLQTYTIRETCSLFGDFFGSNRMCLIMSDHKVSSTSPIRAIKVYMKQYKRDSKQKNEYEREQYTETTEKWGKLMVVDKKGYKTFY